MNLMMRLVKEEEGQGMTEYALILALISIAAVGVLVAFKEPLKLAFQTALDGLSGNITP